MRKPITTALSLLLCLLLCACGKAETTLPEPTITPEQREQLKAELKEEIMSEIAENEPNAASGEYDSEPPKATQNGEIRPEFKEFLDSYEAFMDEYVDFMKHYQNADVNDMMGMLTKYTEILTKYADFEEKIDALDESTMSTAELSYYLEVTNRVSQKLLSVVG